MSDEIEIKNAVIEDVRLGYDRGTFLCAWIYLDYGGSGQGFGGYVLAKNTPPTRPLNDFGMEYINRILSVVGAESWEKLKGMSCRVKANWGHVYAIGHYLKDKWFDPEELRRECGLADKEAPDEQGD